MENMNYLKSVAYQKLYVANICELPINPYSLAKVLKIHLKRKSSYIDEWERIVSPRTNQDIFSLSILGEYTIYYNDNIKNINYLVIYEMSKHLLYLLGESTENVENIELLTLFFMAPPCIINTLNISSVSDISALCDIPAHKVKKYIMQLTHFSDSRIINFENKLNDLFSGFIQLYKSSSLLNAARNKFSNYSNIIIGQDLKKEEPDKNSKRAYRIVHPVYIQESITPYYHEYDCDLIKNKIDIVETSIKNAEDSNYKPCPKCIKNL